MSQNRWKYRRPMLLVAIASMVVGSATLSLQAAPSEPQTAVSGTFTNPLMPRSTADPWLIYYKGFYYFTFTTGGSVEIWKSATLTGLKTAKKVTIWHAPSSGPNSRDIWAPEIHRVRGKWYVYFTGTDGPDVNRRQFVLEATTDDPQGEYKERGKLVVPQDDYYAIDGTILETKAGNLYYIWSGRSGGGGGSQNIYIAPMANPWTLSGQRVQLSTPEFDWEKHGWAVNEGPEVLEKGKKTIIVYSGSGGTTPNYCLGMLVNSTGDLLNSAAWKKSTVPVFQRYSGPDGEVFTPGHNGFCKSPDGKEDWIVYHGKSDTDNTWGGRTARTQRFYWNTDGLPVFGHPVPPGVPLALPSGEPGALVVKNGKGSGLRGRYYTGDRSARPVFTRIDPFIGFDWGITVPGKGVGANDFFAVWEGEIEPRFSETYTFQTYSGDHIRVSIDGKPVIDNWTAHAPTADQGQITLSAGHRYPIRIEYRQTLPAAPLLFSWSSPHQGYEPVPTSQLYPVTAKER